eukprot:gnl/MRDRNA2_/MRDRNA2_33884_c0_seq1.p1 gnl/MRDRNA2_/MRDRNA2_33884_c0~~gnl/MRDRNA2_/MRDRNA2_33884_c0_seq1.p1  ORF type:complete len:291 (-),score=73.18 gnl/MRDRNA2_/MRDRNA2_33884_c0_seq1:367-1239(-)
MLNSQSYQENKLVQLKASCDQELRRLADEKDRQIDFLRDETAEAERRLLSMRQKHAEEIQKLEARLAEEKRASDAERFHARKLEGSLDRLNDERRDRVVGRDKLLNELEKAQKEAHQQHQRSEALAFQLKTREEANLALIKEIEDCRAQVVRERLMRDSAVAEAQRLWQQLKSVNGNVAEMDEVVYFPEKTLVPSTGDMAPMNIQDSVYGDLVSSSFALNDHGKHRSSGSRSRRKHKEGKHHHHHHQSDSSLHRHHSKERSRDHHRHLDHPDHHHHHHHPLKLQLGAAFP